MLDQRLRRLTVKVEELTKTVAALSERIIHLEKQLHIVLTFGTPPNEELMKIPLIRAAFQPCHGECGNTDLDTGGVCHRTHLLPR